MTWVQFHAAKAQALVAQIHTADRHDTPPIGLNVDSCPSKRCLLGPGFRSTTNVFQSKCQGWRRKHNFQWLLAGGGADRPKSLRASLLLRTLRWNYVDLSTSIFLTMAMIPLKFDGIRDQDRALLLCAWGAVKL